MVDITKRQNHSVFYKVTIYIFCMVQYIPMNEINHAWKSHKELSSGGTPVCIKNSHIRRLVNCNLPFTVLSFLNLKRVVLGINFISLPLCKGGYRVLPQTLMQLQGLKIEKRVKDCVLMKSETGLYKEC